MCQSHSVPLILVDLGSNLRDCPPFKSEHREELRSQELQQWEQSFQAAGAMEMSDPAGALALYWQAEAVDDKYALLAYRIARCLDRLDRFKEARPQYLRAKDLDVCPLRMLEATHQALADVAAKTNTPLVNARGLLCAQSAQQIPGYDWYLDQVHPTIGGHQLIARALVDQLEQLGLTRRGARWRPDRRRAAYQKHMTALGDLYLAQGRRRVEWLANWSRRDRLREDTQPFDARAWLDLGHTFLDFGDSPAAHRAYQAALDADPPCAARLLDRALQLFGQGRRAAAHQLAMLVREVAVVDEVRARARLALVILAWDAGKTEAARAEYFALALTPGQATDIAGPWFQEVPGVLTALGTANR